MKSHSYLVELPPKMLPGRAFRTFTSPAAFDGYVAELRRVGYLVEFNGPSSARVRRA